MGPFASLVFDQAGKLYGTTYGDGNNRGSVFKLAPSGDSWVYTDCMTSEALVTAYRQSAT